MQMNLRISWMAFGLMACTCLFAFGQEQGMTREAEKAFKEAQATLKAEWKQLEDRIDAWDKLAKILAASDRAALGDIPSGQEWTELIKALPENVLPAEANAELMEGLRELKADLGDDFLYALEDIKSARDTIKKQMDNVNSAVEFYELCVLFRPETGGPVASFERFTQVIDGPVTKLAQKVPGIGHMIGFYASACREVGTAFARLQNLLEQNRGALCNEGLSPAYRTYRDRYEDRYPCGPHLRVWCQALDPIRAYENGHVYLFLNESDAGHGMLDKQAFNILHRAFRTLRMGRIYYVDRQQLSQAATPERFMQRALSHVSRGQNDLVVRHARFNEWFDKLRKDCFRDLLVLAGVKEGPYQGTRTIRFGSFAYPVYHASLGHRDEFTALCHYYAAFHSRMHAIMETYGDKGLLGGYIRARDGKALRDLRVMIDGEPVRKLEPLPNNRFRYEHIVPLEQNVDVTVSARGYDQETVAVRPRLADFTGNCWNRQDVVLDSDTEEDQEDDDPDETEVEEEEVAEAADVDISNSVMILIDASGSMRGAKIASAIATANNQIQRLGPDTELAVRAFSGNAVSLPFTLMTSDGQTRAQAVISSIRASGPTPLAAAIRRAGGYMRSSARGGNLTLIILSDGEETAGGDPPAEIRRLNDMSVKW